MHSTWQAGDPVVQLDFPNPLNVSVQLGDIAYFSNPTPVGIVGNPSSGEQWTSTTTPHLTNEQQHIIMIGEIIQIIPWDGTVSSIICNMPQDVFNQYFAQIVAGGCVSVASGNPTCTGNCCNFDTSYSSAVAVPQTTAFDPSTAAYWQDPSNIGDEFFFDNPTLSVHDYMIHRIVPTPGAFDSISVSNNWCLLENNHPNYVPGYINYWGSVSPYSWTDEDGLEWGPFLTAGLFTDFLIGLYPDGGFFQGMSFSLLQAWSEGMIHRDEGAPITGTYSDTYTETCTPGSFIMFSKDNKVNMSSILGYYAAVEFKNSSKVKSEIFNVGTSFFESSK
jgi:hypothetical protein